MTDFAATSPPSPPRGPAAASVTVRRPIIGVTGPDRGGTAAWIFTWFVLAISGASARRITPRNPCNATMLDGLIVGGGADVDPHLYGQDLVPLLRPEPQNQRSFVGWLIDAILFPLTWLLRHLLARSSDQRQDRRRDTLETRLIREALSHQMPILGICRGMQLLNVTLGGTLHQDLGSFHVEGDAIRSIRPRKQIQIAADTHLAEILQSDKRWVNALHRQAVDQVGVGLQISARDKNGVVQAIERSDDAFILGVQWHPEFLPQIPEQRRIFRALVRAARRE